MAGLLERCWDCLASLILPPWVAGLSTMPPRDRVACVDWALEDARRTGFPKLARCEPHSQLRHLHVVPDAKERGPVGPRSIP